MDPIYALSHLKAEKTLSNFSKANIIIFSQYRFQF